MTLSLKLANAFRSNSGSSANSRVFVNRAGKSHHLVMLVAQNRLNERGSFLDSIAENFVQLA